MSYTETGNAYLDHDRLEDPSDGHMDAVHLLRDRVGADPRPSRGRRVQCGRFSFLGWCFQPCRALLFRARARTTAWGSSTSAIRCTTMKAGRDRIRRNGYVNQRAFEPGAAPSSCWSTIMAYGAQCRDEGLRALGVTRFSNPRQQHEGDPLGVPYTGNGESRPHGAGRCVRGAQRHRPRRGPVAVPPRRPQPPADRGRNPAGPATVGRGRHAGRRRIAGVRRPPTATR